MAVARIAAQPHNHARVLDGIVRIIQLRAHDAHARLRAQGQHLAQPCAVDDFHVIVEQQQIFAPGGLTAEIVDGTEIETALVRHDAAVGMLLLQLPIIVKGGGLHGIVLDDKDLIVGIRRFGEDGRQRLAQIVRVVLVRDEDGDKRISLDGILHLVGAWKQAVRHRALCARARQMPRNGAFGRRSHIGLRPCAAGGGALVHTPVIQHLGNMHRHGPLAQLQEQVVVLAAVTGRVQPSHSVEQSLLEHGKMADVIAAVEVIRRKIRFEVACRGPAHVRSEQRLVAVQKRRARLVSGLHHLVYRMRRQHVVVVGKGQVLPGGQRGGSVGVGRDAFVFHLRIYDTRVPGLIGAHRLRHITVGRVAGVGQAELPIRAGLAQHAVQQLAQVFLRRIVQRYADAHRRPAQRAVIQRALGRQRFLFGQKTPFFAAEAPLQKCRRTLERGAEAIRAHRLGKEARQLPHALDFQIHG